MKMGDNNVIESKGKLYSEFYCENDYLLFLCGVLENNPSITSGKVEGRHGWKWTKIGD